MAVAAVHPAFQQVVQFAFSVFFILVQLLVYVFQLVFQLPSARVFVDFSARVEMLFGLVCSYRMVFRFAFQISFQPVFCFTSVVLQLVVYACYCVLH